MIFLNQSGSKFWNGQGEDRALEELLTVWAEHSPLPLVLLIDEIDALVGDTLIAVLRQLRAGYAKRPRSFPQSVILCGVRDVRDYRIHSNQEKAIITGGSAFNIKAESLRLGNFIRGEMESLYRRHTDETGQIFTVEALDRLWELAQGQPWLVNALGYETCFKMKAGRDRQQPITVERVDEGQGKSDSAAGNPSGPVGRQAERGTGAAGDRAAPGQRGGTAQRADGRY